MLCTADVYSLELYDDKTSMCKGSMHRVLCCSYQGSVHIWRYSKYGWQDSYHSNIILFYVWSNMRNWIFLLEIKMENPKTDGAMVECMEEPYYTAVTTCPQMLHVMSAVIASNQSRSLCIGKSTQHLVRVLEEPSLISLWTLKGRTVMLFHSKPVHQCLNGACFVWCLLLRGWPCSSGAGLGLFVPVKGTPLMVQHTKNFWTI